MKDGKKIVFVQGAFELSTWAHMRTFKRAKALGDYLIVALNSNELLKDYKKRDAILPWYQKKELIESIKYVDKVIVANDFSPLELLKKHKVDVYVLTKEWKHTKATEIAYMKSIGGKVSWSPRFKGGIATSEIKRVLLKEAQEGYMQ